MINNTINTKYIRGKKKGKTLENIENSLLFLSFAMAPNNIRTLKPQVIFDFKVDLKY